MNNPLVSCIMPTYNKCPHSLWLVNEAVQCFLDQDYQNKELVLVNDTPGQTLVYNHPQVKLFNLDTRFETLSDKIQFGIDNSNGDLLMRLDDDDIHMPWRITKCVNELGNDMALGTHDHWYYEHFYGNIGLIHNHNWHCTAIWKREVMDIVGKYSPKQSYGEDVAFSKLIVDNNIPHRVSSVSPKEAFLIYRWATSSIHLSGQPDSNPLDIANSHYARIGKHQIEKGVFTLEPKLTRDYQAIIDNAILGMCK